MKATRQSFRAWNDFMFLKDLIVHFNIEGDFPQHLLEESFNEVFLKGKFFECENGYKIVAETRKNITHTMILNPDDEFPIIVISKRPNGALNGIKFSRIEGKLEYVDRL